MRLSDFRGRKAVALIFFPFAFTGVCTGELSAVRDRLDEFLSFDTEVLALSCDSVYALRSFAEAEGLNFPLLSDYWPHGAVASAYEVFDSVKGAPRRSSYVVDLRRAAAVVGAQRQPRRSGPRRAPARAPRGPVLSPEERTGLDRLREISDSSDRLGWRCNLLLVEPLVTRDASGSTHFHFRRLRA